MPTHYPQTVPNENRQGLHYSRFPPIWRERDFADQWVTPRSPRKIVEIGGESAKLG